MVGPVNCSSLGIGLAGLGTVGSGVVLALERNASLICDRTGGVVNLEVAKVLVRDLAKVRPVNLPAEKLTTSWQELVEDPAVDIVVELIGGTTDAFEIVAAALKAGKPVVTSSTMPRSISRRRLPAAFRSSKRCRSPSSGTASTRSRGSSTALPITSWSG
jgi:homoserine dehydrogenase